MTPEDRRFIGLTFDLARKGTGRTSPNPLVGALVVKDGAILGRGYHARAGEEHAETLALREAGDRARGASLYVNLEPCCHHRLLRGRTDPCVDQIVAAGVGRVVAAARDPNPAMNGRGLAKLAQVGVAVETIDPVVEAAAARLNEIWFAWVTRREPFVALKAGMTLDGRIALPSKASKWITGDVARARARTLRSRYDAVLVGIETVLADDPMLTPASEEPSETGARPDRPLRLVLDSRLRLPPGSRLVSDARSRPVLVYTSSAAAEERCRDLESRGITVVRAGDERVSIAAMLADLAAREVTSLLVEGGGAVLGSFLAEGRADKLHLFVAPRILRGQDAVAVFGGASPRSLTEAWDVDIVEIHDVGGDLLLEAVPRPRAPGAVRASS